MNIRKNIANFQSECYHNKIEIIMKTLTIIRKLFKENTK